MIIDLYNIYSEVFGEPYKLSNLGFNTISKPFSPLPAKVESQKITSSGLPLTVKNAFNKEIFAPIEFYKNSTNYLQVPCATIRVSSKKTIVRTAVSERKGTAKEVFSVGDYQFTIKGILIGQSQQFPEDQILKLIDIYETRQQIELYNAFTELFMSGESRKIVVESLEFPEVQGKALNMRAFVLSCESDFIDTVIVQ
ncbi:MAG: DUF6046 domain-containing protein [Lentimicrobium sp.]|jgi:hypothetical protein|nr:DUF6046 domain-containing protein [Lentimicrobium sp.]